MKPYPVFLAVEIGFLYQHNKPALQIDREINCRTGDDSYRQYYRDLIQKWVWNVFGELRFPAQNRRLVLKNILNVNKNSRIYREFNQSLEETLKDKDIQIEDLAKKVINDPNSLPAYSKLLQMREGSELLLTNIPKELDGDIFSDLYSLAESGNPRFEQYGTHLLGSGQNPHKPE